MHTKVWSRLFLLLGSYGVCIPGKRIIAVFSAESRQTVAGVIDRRKFSKVFVVRTNLLQGYYPESMWRQVA